MRKVLAVLIPASTNFSRTEIEVLSAGRRIADDLGGALAAVVLGSAGDTWNKECASYGADTVYRIADTALGRYQTDWYVAALKQIYDVAQPELILIPSTTYGLEILPIFAYRVGSSATLDCIGLKGDSGDGSVTITKPVYGGKANSEMVAKTGPVVVAIRMRSVVPAMPAGDRAAEVVNVSVTFDPAKARTKIIERLTEETGATKLEDARVIVSGGRGLGGPEAFADLTALATMLGGTIGASRAACDQGWVPASLQIGQTGKKVAPDLYLAVGISGASQHMVGITGARHIVAINKDAKAPIFQMATCGVVDDFKSFLPQFTAALREYKAKNQGTSHG
jgi:electron transfer flavoprotein alpha subunit